MVVVVVVVLLSMMIEHDGYRLEKKSLANSEDPDETPHDSASHQGLRCLHKGISIVFSKHCSARDIHELVAQAAGCSKYCSLTLKDDSGAHVSMSPAMPCNTPTTPYKVQIQQPTSNQ
ncbi:hypothetical protein DPMN_078859, partial [Dreissena polymorpha]